MGNSALCNRVQRIANRIAPDLIVQDTAANPGVLLRACSNAPGHDAQDRAVAALANRLCDLDYYVSYAQSTSPTIYIQAE